MTTIYKIFIKATETVEKFQTNLNERDFYKSLDAVYGADAYMTLDIDYSFSAEHNR